MVEVSVFGCNAWILWFMEFFDFVNTDDIVFVHSLVSGVDVVDVRDCLFFDLLWILVSGLVAFGVCEYFGILFFVGNGKVCLLCIDCNIEVVKHFPNFLVVFFLAWGF